MAFIVKSFIVAILFVIIQVIAGNPSARIINGIPLDKFARFPHHVEITNDNGRCSGNIINERWILTSMRCAQHSEKYRIDFQRLHYNQTEYDNPLTYSITVDKSSAILYPTQYPQQDDIALIKLPIILDFSDPNYLIKPIKVSSTNLFNSNKLGVMAGFGEDKNILTYGMFRRNYECPGVDGNLQFCANGWNGGSQVPCHGNEGGGLIVNWPQDPTLIGIFSYSKDCSVGATSIYTDVSKYLLWIQFVIRGNLPSTTDSLPNPEIYP